MGLGSFFKKLGRSVGNVFKKGVGVVGSIAKKAGSELSNLLPMVGGAGGSALGAEIADGVVLALGQPELLPVATVIGGGVGGFGGKQLGKEAKRRLTMPLPRDSVGGSRQRLGADPRTFTPIQPKMPTVRTPKKFLTPRNELERAKIDREPETTYG